MDLQKYIDYIQEAARLNDWKTWLIWLGVLIFIFFLFHIIKKIVISSMKKVTDKSKNKVDDQLIYIIDGTGSVLFFTLALYLSSGMLNLSDPLRNFFQTIAILGFLIQIGFWLNRITHIKLGAGSSQNQVKTLQTIIRVIGWTIIGLLALDNLGIKINTLVASLGITSIAIGLASQAVLTDLISSILITLDKPFEEGDFITVGDYMGTVENIGWKNTRIRALSGELLVFNNSTLQSSTIQNYQHLERRRINLTIGVIYETPAEKLEKIPDIVKNVIDSLGSSISFDRTHFAKLSDFSLDFEVIYYIESSDYVKFMDLQQAVNLNLFKRFEEENISFAYPTQAVYIESSNGSITLPIEPVQ